MSYEYMMGFGTDDDVMDFRSEEQASSERMWDLIRRATGSTPSTEVRPLPPELEEPAAPAAEKQTWWTGDVEGMVSSFFSKIGIGEQADADAQDAAREAAGETMGPTSIRDVVPEGEQPTVDVEGRGDDNGNGEPWYVQYAPHMVIGGLGLGAVITLVLVMRNR